MPHARAAGDVTCCSAGCEGQECVRARTLLHELASELVLLESRVASVLQKGHRSPSEVSLLLVSRQIRSSSPRLC